jgi:hypothetical protein
MKSYKGAQEEIDRIRMGLELLPVLGEGVAS